MSDSKPRRRVNGIGQKTQQFSPMSRPQTTSWTTSNANGQDTVAMARLARGSSPHGGAARGSAPIGPTHTLRAAPRGEPGTRIANVGELVMREQHGEIASAGLGSCIAIVGWSPAAKVGGMLHFMLPSSEIDQARSESNPTMFCDTGLVEFSSEFRKRGVAVRDLRIWLVGGASMHDAIGAFDVGRRNLLTARKEVWRLGLQVFAEAVGGNAARTATLSVNTGRLVIREPGVAPRDL